jgi:GNAT superfamily N-acetyltransferase
VTPSYVVRWLGLEEPDPPPWLITAARADPWCRGSHFSAVAPGPHVLITDADDTPIGLYTPYQGRLAEGATRLDPLYLLSEARGLGIASALYRRLALGGPVLAFIATDNTPAARAAEAGGLSPWRRARGGTYWRSQ